MRARPERSSQRVVKRRAAALECGGLTPLSLSAGLPARVGRVAGLFAVCLLLFAAAQKPHPADYMAAFNRALAAFRSGDYARAVGAWARVAGSDAPAEVRALALYDAGNAAFKAKRYDAARRAYLESLRRLDACGTPAWPEDLSARRRARLWSAFRGDLLFNLELAQRMLAAAPQPSQQDKGGKHPRKQPTPTQPRAAQSHKGEPTPGKPDATTPGKVPPLSPEQIDRLLRRALARDTAPPPKKRTGAQDGRPDW